MCRHTIVPRRPMRPSNDLRHLAFLQQLSQPPPGKRSRHFSATIVFFPVHHHPAPAPLSASLHPALYVHDQDDHHADLWNHAFHVGSRCCRRLWPNLRHVYEDYGRYTSGRRIPAMRHYGDWTEVHAGVEHARFHSIRKVSKASVLAAGCWADGIGNFVWRLGCDSDECGASHLRCACGGCLESVVCCYAVGEQSW